MKKVLCMSVCLFALNSTHAAQIGIGAFSGSESIEDFSTLGTAPSSRSFSHGGMTFTEASTGIGGAGWRLTGNSVLSDNADNSNITIDFDTPYSRVGLNVGFYPSNQASTYDVSFYDASLSLLGVARITGNGSQFVGWEDVGGIARINIVEPFGGNGYVTGMDNIRFENMSAVPVPASAWLLGSGLLALVRSARRSAT